MRPVDKTKRQWSPTRRVLRPGGKHPDEGWYHVYLLKSLVDENYYIGHTKNIEKRLRQHNAGLVRSTRNRKPFKLVGYENYKSQSEARWREYQLKHHGDRKKNFIKKLEGKVKASGPAAGSESLTARREGPTARRDIGIDLGELRGWLREHKGPPNVPYPPLESLKSSDLTYEIFLELINKTDYLTRKLVESLQKKMERDEETEKLKIARAWEWKYTS